MRKFPLKPANDKYNGIFFFLFTLFLKSVCIVSQYFKEKVANYIRLFEVQ